MKLVNTNLKLHKLLEVKTKPKKREVEKKIDK